jgi:hypothetical protein
MTNDPQTPDPVRGHLRSQPRFNGNDATPGRAKAKLQTDGPADTEQQGLPDGKGLKYLFNRFQELQHYALCYASSRTDGVKHSLRNSLGQTVPAALGFVTMAGLVVLASWFALSGLAQGLGEMFGDRAWIGKLITGGVVLAGVMLWGSCAAWIRKSASRKRTIEKYEARRARQRTRLNKTYMTGRQHDTFDTSTKSEGDFLEDRVTDAQKAMIRSLGDMRNAVSQMTDVRSRAARHPWTMIGSAIAVGIVAGAMRAHSKRTNNKSGPNTASNGAHLQPRVRRDDESPHTMKSLLFSISGTVLATTLPRLLQSWLAPVAPAKRESNQPPQ